MNRTRGMEITGRVISKEGKGEEWRKGTRNKKYKQQVQTRQGDVRDSMGNGKAEELI